MQYIENQFHSVQFVPCVYKTCIYNDLFLMVKSIVAHKCAHQFLRQAYFKVIFKVILNNLV